MRTPVKARSSSERPLLHKYLPAQVLVKCMLTLQTGQSEPPLQGTDVVLGTNNEQVAERTNFHLSHGQLGAASLFATHQSQRLIRLSEIRCICTSANQKKGGEIIVK